MSNLKTIVRGAYDIQKLRIQMGNRIVINFKAKLGQGPSEKEIDIDAQGKEILRILRVRYKKITDGIKSFPRQSTFKGNEVISTFTELALISQYVDLESNEDKHFRMLKNILADYPIYSDYLKQVKGVGPAMAGVILSEIDIHKARYPSSLWAYAGLDVAGDGKGRSRRKEHLTESTYTAKDGEEKTKLGITFNPFLKTKLVGVLGASFLRVGKDNTYAKIYYDYKHRLENHDTYKDVSKGHRHNMAIRYMIKMFLRDLYVEWRTMEGLPVSPSYQESKLGYKHVA